MLELGRNLIQITFTVLYAVIMVLTVVFVLPFVWVKEFLAEHRSRTAARRGQHAPPAQNAPKIVALLLLVGSAALILSGCTTNFSQATQKVQNTVQDSVTRSRQVLDRTLDFARGAPAAPYHAAGNRREFDTASKDNNLQLNGTQLTLIAGAASAAKTDAATVAMVIEQELRWLDDNELERDVLSALTGEDSSIGIGQVRVSTAEELEQEDPANLLPKLEKGDQAHTERVRRLANDDWNILYVASYVNLLEQRHSYEGPLDIAQYYVGATPSSPKKGDQAELYDTFKELF